MKNLIERLEGLELNEMAGPANVAMFLILLTSKVTQYDKRAQKSRFYNIYALGQYLEVIDKIDKKVSSIKTSDDADDLKKLKRIIGDSFTSDFSPANFVMKSIDKYLATGAIPKITGKAGTKQMR